ncbi:hypothetical protein K493DRAFT_68700 [Basidiobolus meristosporus CBS 931.73]|uniref:Uncharacterized protein n=1 Tax=Basidiobolus meristosporus CBS 931.73 TaxID=1314790 RepID=A0A1Y1XUE4_9FUNG|nr:hypothetical protein K493DRAFT_68700 [Basidiobolus meristosporus CBS 931.73]|eukprot:ORX89387.1 hypothetical protein K493DRAFT_68700 [Basidiobolus meristosporus CBS 931.73]
MQTELNSLTDAGFEVTELASVLQDITNELYGHKHVTSESSSLQDLGQVKAELTRFKDRCRSLEHALRESNKTLHAVMSKPASPHMEKGTIGREGRSDKERVQQVAHIMEDRQVFGDESSKQQLLYNKKVAGYLKMNREYRQENILETKQSMLAIHGSHQERHDGLEATKIKGNGSRYANCNGQGHGRGHDTPKFLDDAPLTAEPAMTQGSEFSDNATRKPPTSVRGYKQSPLSLIQ